MNEKMTKIVRIVIKGRFPVGTFFFIHPVYFKYSNGKNEVNFSNEYYTLFYQDSESFIANNGEKKDFKNNRFERKIQYIPDSNYKRDNNKMIKFALKFSKKLSFILGMDTESITQEYSGFDKEEKTEIVKKRFPFMPDEMAGINLMYIYCDKVKPYTVGDTKSELLAIVPLHYATNNTNENIFIYSPPSVYKELVNDKFDSMTITVLDSNGKYIPFDSGNINIECEIK